MSRAIRVGRLPRAPRSPTISTPDFTGRSRRGSPAGVFISHAASRGIVMRPLKSELRTVARWLAEHTRTVPLGGATVAGQEEGSEAAATALVAGTAAARAARTGIRMCL